MDGHTDNVPLLGTGEFKDNWQLSQARALSVVRYMQRDLGFPPKGWRQPVSENISRSPLATPPRPAPRTAGSS